jgi:hypothetical protein
MRKLRLERLSNLPTVSKGGNRVWLRSADSYYKAFSAIQPSSLIVMGKHGDPQRLLKPPKLSNLTHSTFFSRQTQLWQSLKVRHSKRLTTNNKIEQL